MESSGWPAAVLSWRMASRTLASNCVSEVAGPTSKVTRSSWLWLEVKLKHDQKLPDQHALRIKTLDKNLIPKALPEARYSEGVIALVPGESLGHGIIPKGIVVIPHDDVVIFLREHA